MKPIEATGQGQSAARRGDACGKVSLAGFDPIGASTH